MNRQKISMLATLVAAMVATAEPRSAAAQSKARRGVDASVSAPSPCPPSPAGADQQLTATPSQIAEAFEISYVECLFAAARHHGSRAGRAGGYPPNVDPFADCDSGRRLWRDALAAANPEGGTAAADAYIETRLTGVQPRVFEALREAYDNNNYD